MPIKIKKPSLGYPLTWDQVCPGQIYECRDGQLYMVVLDKGKRGIQLVNHNHAIVWQDESEGTKFRKIDIVIDYS